MSAELRFTSADLALMPDDGKRYEIIAGELHVSEQPCWSHQYTCSRIARFLDAWSEQSGLGMPNAAPGLIFAADDDVAPDVVWISNERLSSALQGGKLHAAPELAVEVLSPGSANEQRDRDTKRKLYARRGVQEYWIVYWQLQQVEVYRREQATLTLMETLLSSDTLTSSLLPGFACAVARLFVERTHG
ncbi:MAG: Uma2 family endonuclease [Chloroflexaceae bacterium]|jgi:Uma2 family endonuclease|nr:Uma2 family endonuclease [Chloroflexaceae bacterium]